MQAERTYIQDHLGNSTYLKSQEAAVAEDFINAFKNFDIEVLDKARSPISVMYVDTDFQDFARNLSFMASDISDQYGASATAPFASAAPRKAPAASAKPTASASAAPAPSAQAETSLEDELNALNIEASEAGASAAQDGDAEEDFDALVGGIDQVHSQAAAHDDEINLC
jgi:hypothetical protein